MIHTENICALFSAAHSMKTITDIVVQVVGYIHLNTMNRLQFMELKK